MVTLQERPQELRPLMRMNFVCPEHGPMTAKTYKLRHRIDYLCVDASCERLHSWPLLTKQPWYSKFYMSVLRLHYWIFNYEEYAAAVKCGHELAYRMQIHMRQVAWQKKCGVPIATCTECDTLGLGVDDGSLPLICHECSHFMWTTEDLETYKESGFGEHG